MVSSMIEPIAGALVPAGADPTFEIASIRILQLPPLSGNQARRSSAATRRAPFSLRSFGSSMVWWFSQLHRNVPSR